MVAATAACSASPPANSTIELIVQDVEASAITMVRGPTAAAAGRWLLLPLALLPPQSVAIEQTCDIAEQSLHAAPQ